MKDEGWTNKDYGLGERKVNEEAVLIGLKIKN
jgi:hypothetical protein